MGGKGDGETSDGDVINRIIESINQAEGDVSLTVIFSGTYNIIGSSLKTEDKILNFKHTEIRGLKPIKRDGIKIIFKNGAGFIVARKYDFCCVERGDSKINKWAQGLIISGKNITITGGILNENLHEIKIKRGPRERNFGGKEFGLLVNGENYRIYGMTLKYWGTDNINISKNATLKSVIVDGASRNNISIVAREYKIDMVDISHATIINSSQYAESEYNASGSGIHVEGTAQATINVTDSKIYSSRKSSIRLSTGAINCLIQKCVINTNIDLRRTGEGHLGGHTFRKNMLENVTIRDQKLICRRKNQAINNQIEGIYSYTQIQNNNCREITD